MKPLIAKSLFLYGCASALVEVVLLLLLASRERPDIGSLGLFLLLSAMHSMVLCITLRVYPGLSYWSPIFRPTKLNIRIARVALCMSAVYALVRLLVLFVFMEQGRALGDNRAASALVAMALWSSIYISSHWAFRPENIFSRKGVDFLMSPLAWIALFIVRKIRR